MLPSSLPSSFPISPGPVCSDLPRPRHPLSPRAGKPPRSKPQVSSGLVPPVTGSLFCWQMGFWLLTQGEGGSHTCHLGSYPVWYLWWHLGTTGIVEWRHRPLPPKEHMAHQPDRPQNQASTSSCCFPSLPGPASASGCFLAFWEHSNLPHFVCFTGTKSVQ